MELSEEVVDEFMENVPMSVRLAKFRTKSSKRGYIVTGHRYTNDGWFVSAEDAKGSLDIPYMEATDSVGMPIYEEREFEEPNINDKTKADNDVKNEINDYSRDKLKPDNERKNTSPLSTSFLPLSKKGVS